MKKKHVILGFILTLALFPILYLGFFFPGEKITIEEERETENQKSRDEANQKNDREKKKYSFIEPDGECGNLIKGTTYESMAFESQSKYWIEFVFFKKGNGKLMKDGIYRWLINPIKPDGSFADKGSSSAARAVDKIFRLRFGLTEKNAGDGVFLADQLHRFEFKTKLNGRWYKQRFRTPSIDSMKEGEVKRYPILLNAYENKKQETKESDKREAKKFKNYSIKFKLTNIPEIKRKNSELWVSYVKNGEELLKNEYLMKNIQKNSIEFTVKHKASSRKDLFGGSLFVYSLSGKMEKDWVCAKWYLYCLKNNIKKKQLDFKKNNAFYRNDGDVKKANINMNDYMKGKFNTKIDTLEKLYLVYPVKDRTSFPEHPVNVVIKTGTCIKDLSQVEISAPKGKYHLKYTTNDSLDKKIAKRNLEWPP